MSRKLSISKAKIDQAVILAAAYRDKSDEIFPPSKGPVDVVTLIEKHGPQFEQIENSNESRAFHTFLVGLTFLEMRELQALMYLGRGDWTARDFWRRCDDLSMDDDAEVEAEHVMSKAPFVEYVSAGFDLLNQNRMV